jgi:hypothetical protein
VISYTGGLRRIQVYAPQIACKAKAAAAARMTPCKGAGFRLRQASHVSVTTLPPGEPPVKDRRHTSEDGWRETIFNPLMLERQMFTAEPSYFNFLMEHRCMRRVPFTRAVGLIPDLTSVVRARRPQRVQAMSLKSDIKPGR